jgi:tetratricopeptide (TPR) repeat protein
MALPLATGSDRRRVEAARLEAKACLDYPVIERGQAGADAFSAAAQLHARNGDRRQEGLSRLHAAGVRYTRLADWSGAAELAAQAELLLARADAPAYAAFAVRLEGAALDQRANAGGVDPAEPERDRKLARERLTQAAERFQALGNSYEAGYALNYRGVSYDVAGDNEQARQDFQAALELFKSVGDRPAQALSLQSLASQSYHDGRLSDAMREFNEVLGLIPRDEDPENYAHTLNNSAWPFRAVGQFDEATKRFYEASKILSVRGDRDGEARALHGLATTLMQSGESERAKELLQAAVHLRGETGARREQAISLLALGELERKAGRLEQAIAHETEALRLVTAPHDFAQARLFLARAYLADDQLAQARKELEVVLQLQLPATHHYLGLALAELGVIESLAERNGAAREYFARALSILLANGSDLEHARTLVRRAESQLRAEDAASAVADTKAAIAELESIGLQSLQAENRAAFRASYRDALEIQIAGLLKLADKSGRSGNDNRSQEFLRSALAVSDLGRAQKLNETDPAYLARLPEELQLRRRQLYEGLAGKRQQRDRLLGVAKPDEDRIAELTRDIARLRIETSLLEDKILGSDAAKREHARSQDSGSLVVRAPKDTVVAEYFVGGDHAWLFELRNDRVEVHALGTGREVEKLARDLHLTWRRFASSQTDRLDNVTKLARRLFGKLDLSGADKTLYIIPDGALYVVPMAVIAQHYLSLTTSGSVRIAPALAAIGENRVFERPDADGLLAVIADPIYSADDSRILGTESAPQTALVDPMLTRYARNLAQIRRLPSTAVEARAIASIAGRSSVPLMLIGADATRRNIAAARLDRYQFIHFATHAFADSQDPALATLALSRFDRDGNPLDGDLRAFDIAQLHLNADLIVLSSCDTAIGREIAGEAPLGLSQAFLRSGARSVLATLWQVPDASTARLMEVFYREMFVNGQSPAAALELAQQSIRKLPRWSDPYYWAGFQLVSNARFEVGNKNVERRGG